MAVHLICKGSRVAVRKRQEKGEDNGQTRPFMPLRGAGPGAAGRSGQRSTVPDSRSSRAQSNSEIPELLVRAVGEQKGAAAFSRSSESDSIPAYRSANAHLFH